MWCRVCENETTEDVCSVCGCSTISENLGSVDNTIVHYCKNCNTPVIFKLNDSGFGSCPICFNKTDYLAKDIRPVFPEEKLLLELLLQKRPGEFENCSVWASNSRYYVDGKQYAISSETFKKADTEEIIKELEKNKFLVERQSIGYDKFEKNINLFVKANKKRLKFLKNEAISFIKHACKNFGEEQIVLSFSGGKDSTATADIVIKALGNPTLTHVFGDTTLEFPQTYVYTQRYKDSHPLSEFRVAKNSEQDFHKVCEDIGPPARMMRWCCSMFKTGPITRVMNRKYGNKQILTFYGIRKVESTSRSKYSRISENTENVKIQKQTVASPIFFWKDIDVWLYILGENVDFNDAYRLGYDRVGCWCCPNNNTRAQFLSRIYMKEQSLKWRTFLIEFAKRIGKPDAEEYVDSEKWKARQGGNGVKAAGDVKLKFTACTSEEHARIYKLVKPFDDSFLNMMVPFGIISKELGRKLIHETIILEPKTRVPIISIQPFSQEGYEYAVKIKTMSVAEHDDLQRMIGYQVKKFNACRKCLKCESVCRQGAISIIGDEYYINPEKCVHCKLCVNQKYLVGGCMMDKYLRTKN
jgi:phosphoadenosine phosphosulfate reductase